MQENSNVPSLTQVAGILRRRAPIVVLCALIVAGAAFGYSKLQTKEYAATASLLFSQNPLSRQVAGFEAEASGNQLARQASNIEMVNLGDMAARTATVIGGGVTELSVRKSITVLGQGESDVVTVSATSTSPALAAKIANTYAGQFVREQQRSDDGFLRHALTLVQKQIRQLPPAQRFGPAAVALQNRAQSLRLLEGLGYGSVSLGQHAIAPTFAISPSTKKNTLIGGLLGLAIGVGLALLLERMSRHRLVRDGGDIAAIYRAPVLGAVARTARLDWSSGSEANLGPGTAEAEAFNLIRARLRYSRTGRDPRVVMVTAAGRGEGATTVALGLAEAAARTGMRTLLLEANGNDPALADRIGVPPRPGLSEILAGESAFPGPVRRVPVVHSPDGGSRNLEVLVNGTTGAARSALVESPTMERLLVELRTSYELVIVDAAAPTVAASTLALQGQVDGVLAVSMIDVSNRDAAAGLARLLSESGARLLGVVADGVDPREVNGFGAGAPPSRPVAPSGPAANGSQPLSPIGSGVDG